MFQGLMLLHLVFLLKLVLLTMHAAALFKLCRLFSGGMDSWVQLIISVLAVPSEGTALPARPALLPSTPLA